MGTSSREAEADPGTARPLPWWSAHAAGLIVCHAAFWFGYWRLGDLRRATGEPVLSGLLYPGELLLITLVLGGMAYAAWNSRRWRWCLVLGCYFLFATCWVVTTDELSRHPLHYWP